MKNKLFLIGLIFLFPLAAATATTTWTGTLDNDWHKACNWNTMAVPTSTDDVVLPPVTNTPTISATACAKTINPQTGSKLKILSPTLLQVGPGPCTPTINSGGSSTNPTSIDASVNPICAGNSTTLSVVGGSLGAGAAWKWYTGSCGGTPAGTGTSISASPASTTPYYVRAEGTCNTGNCVSNTITVNSIPNTPGAITGSAAVCASSTGNVYSISAVAGATSYNWTVPSGASITAGSGTTSITVTFGSSSGDVSVTASNSCGTSAANTLAVTVNTAPVSVSIAAVPSGAICLGTSVTFTATPTNGGSSPSYQWKKNGSNVGTNSATYTDATLINEDAITCVLTSNVSCPTGNPATSNTITMTVTTVPAQPSVITAGTSATICSGVGQTYTVTNVPGTTYTWTYSGTGWSQTAGGTTNSITASATGSGNVTVTPSNSCGSGTPQTLAVTVTSSPAAPTATAATAIISTKITANWNAAAGATTYYLDVSTNEGFSFFVSGYNNLDVGNVTSKDVTGLTYNITYYYRVRAANTCGTSGNSSTLSAITAYATGESYGGGIIFYIDGTGQNGLIAATSDQSTGTDWGCSGTALTGADGTAIGTGNQNTTDIMAGCATAGIAARVARAYSGGGYIDWFLPSKDELNLLYLQKAVVGGFADDYYWSSSEYNANFAFFQYFPTGEQMSGELSKGYPAIYVRAVRAFGSIPAAPTAGTHTPSKTQIVWNWNAVSGATGYKVNTVNDYATATDKGSSLSHTQTPLTCYTDYTLYVWAYNIYGNSPVRTLTQKTSACFAIGESYQGGIIFYVDGTTQHGLIAATSDQSTNTQWWNGSYTTTGATGIIVGTGNANTNAIVSSEGAGSYAARLCYDLVIDVYSDWYLPSKDELDLLYLQKAVVGGFASDVAYWTSTEISLQQCKILVFAEYGSASFNYYKDASSNVHVRAIRAF